jgi:Ser/Thr protein kinase RdoA (MazF antagonist)
MGADKQVGGGFENLTPDAVLGAVERATRTRLTPLIRPLPSYINRVYELRDEKGTSLIAKFYRPGRWDRETIAEEHAFVSDCAQSEVPVVAPVTLPSGSTVGEHEGILFALYPKRAGRRIEIGEQTDWKRLGALVARMHLAGERRPAPHRIVLGPQRSLKNDINHLYSSVLPERSRDKYRAPVQRLIGLCGEWFEGLESIRIHGDCHVGNILDRLDEGLLLIDFDDMAMGPPVQDLWLLLPERADKCRREIETFLEGYERFRRFDHGSLRCIEPLRAMRMVYFVAWCSRQKDDFAFRRTYPDWGSDAFWQRETNELWEQVNVVEEAVGW